MDWTEDAGLHQRYKDWREEVELPHGHGAITHQKRADTKMKFVTLWAGKEARTYLNTLERDDRDSLKTILDSFEEWTKPKSDENSSLHPPQSIEPRYQNAFILHTRGQKDGRFV